MTRSSIVAHSKQAERDVGLLLGGKRLHAGEWKGKGDIDVIADDNSWIAQVKHRKDVAAYIQEGMRQLDEVEENQRTKLLVIKTKPGKGKPSETYVMMRAREWLRSYGSN